MKFSLACAFLCAAASLSAASAQFNVLDYGAVPDGKTKDTEAIARAIAACSKAGGGTVVFPAGKYLTGSIEMVDNLNLQIEGGAELLYSPDPKDSPIVEGRWEDTTAWTRAALIHAFNKTNVSVTGRGTVNGQGANWWWRTGRDPARRAEIMPAQKAWMQQFARVEAGETVTAKDFELAEQYLRPPLVQFNGCKHVLVEGVTLTESPMWVLHPLYCDDVDIRGVTIISTGPNGDGIDVDSCTNLRISDCFFSTGDDCIVIKSGRDKDGRRIHRPTEHIVISNCVMYKGHGAIVIGSETSGDIRDIAASNIVSRGTWNGIRIKSQRGRGGVMENFRFSNFVIEDPTIQAIEITSRYTAEKETHAQGADVEPFSERTPVFRNFAFSNISIIHAAKVASILGLEEQSLHELRFTDITATGEKGIILDRADDVEFHGVRVDVTSGPEYVFSHLIDADLDGVGSHHPNRGEPVISLTDCDQLFIRGCHAVSGTDTFLQINGAKPRDLRMVDNDLTDAKVAVAGLK